jgi:transposase InsO family protein
VVVGFGGGSLTECLTGPAVEGGSDGGQGVIQSMARVGSALDNAVAEAFNSTIKVEYIHRHHFGTRDEARTKISAWITGFYNPRRRHSACGGMSPIDYERYIAEARGSMAA